jgi:hypothetical protein
MASALLVAAAVAALAAMLAGRLAAGADGFHGARALCGR